MKRLILFINIFALFVASFAQTSQVVHSNMLEGNPIWEYYVSYPGWIDVWNEEETMFREPSPQTTFYYYYIDGDSVYDKKKYKKLYSRTISTAGIMSVPHYVCGIREEKGKIIVNKTDIDGEYGSKAANELACDFPPYSWTEETLIDFTLQTGESLFSGYYWTEEDSVYFIMTNKSEITLANGKQSHLLDIHRCFTYKDPPGYMSLKKLHAIEHIGYLDRFIPHIEYESMWGCARHLNRFWRDNQLVYQAPMFDAEGNEKKLVEQGCPEDQLSMMVEQLRMESETFKDNPYLDLFLSTTAVHDVINKAHEHEAIFDLQGRQLRHEPEKGLYIQNGKVRMAR